MISAEEKKNSIEIKLEELAERMAGMISDLHAKRGDAVHKSQEILCVQAEIDMLTEELEEIVMFEHIDDIEEVEFDEEELERIEETYDEQPYAMPAMQVPQRV